MCVRVCVCVLTPKSKASQIVKHLDVENHFILLLGKRGKFTKDVIYSSIEVYFTFRVLFTTGEGFRNSWGIFTKIGKLHFGLCLTSIFTLKKFF